jgi:hypothetical protein
MDDYPEPPADESRRIESTPLGAPQPPFGAVTRALERTAPWTRFLSIVGFIGVVLMIVIGIAAGAIGLMTQRAETTVLMVLYPLMALMYFFPSLYLLQYSKRIGQYVRGGQQLPDLESALEAQRKFWKFAGLMTIVGFALSVVAFAAAVIIGFLARRIDA